MDILSLDRLLYDVVAAVGIGLLVAVAAALTKRFANVHTTSVEGGALCGAVVVAVAVVWLPRSDPAIVAAAALLVVAGYFTIKVVRRRT